jgi:hypothetical protein
VTAVAKLKTYTLGPHGFIDAATRDALGVAPHIRQARVIAVATSKTHAVQVYAEHGFPNVSPRDSEFRVAMGNDLDALTEAGELAEPGVWVMPSLGTGHVARMLPGGVPQCIGRLEFAPDYKATFVRDEVPA